MKVTYRREMNHNYMIVEDEEDAGDGYESRMMAGNHIEGLLKMRIKMVDNKRYFYYEITSRQPIERLFALQGVKAAQISRLLFGISQILERIEVYLLKENQILLDPQTIYMEPETEALSLCLVPGYQGDFPEALTRLLQYLLGKVDHQDKDSVVLAYALFQESQKVNYGMKDLLKLLSAEYQEPDNISQEDFHPVENSVTIIEEKNLLKTKTETVKPKERCWYQLLLIPIIPCALYGWRGLEGIALYWQWAAGLDLFILGITAWLWREKAVSREKNGTSKAEKIPELAPWEMEFEEPEEEKPKSVKAASGQTESEPMEWNKAALHQKGQRREKEGDGLPVAENTALLTGKEERKSCHRLKALEEGLPDIEIGYYPFIIGKQEGIVDFVLKRDTISRLHVRLDSKEGSYTITDLNSTNGTSVNGIMLDNNGSAQINDGDEILIADAPFCFNIR